MCAEHLCMHFGTEASSARGTPLSYDLLPPLDFEYMQLGGAILQ